MSRVLRPIVAGLLVLLSPGVEPYRLGAQSLPTPAETGPLPAALLAPVPVESLDGGSAPAFAENFELSALAAPLPLLGPSLELARRNADSRASVSRLASGWRRGLARAARLQDSATAAKLELDRRWDRSSGRKSSDAVAIATLHSAPEGSQEFGWKLAAQERRAARLIEQLSRDAGFKKTPGLKIVSSPIPNARALRDWRPKIEVTTALLEETGETALRAVLAHELGHLHGIAGRVAQSVLAVPLLSGAAAGATLLAVAPWDPLYSALAGLWTAIPVALAGLVRHLKNEEFVADAFAAKLTGEGRTLAAYLRGLADRGLSGEPDELKARIDRLEGPEAAEAPRPMGLSPVFASGAVAFGAAAPFRTSWWRDLSWLDRVVLGYPAQTWLTAAGIALGGWLAAKLVRAAVARMLKGSTKDPLLKSFFVAMSGYAVYAVTLALVASTLGTSLPNLLTGLGLTAGIIAIPASKVVSNVAGGLSLVSDRPFRTGDRIQVAGYSGKVEDVRLTRTKIDDPKIAYRLANGLFIDNVIVLLDGPSTGPIQREQERKKPRANRWWSWLVAAGLPAAWWFGKGWAPWAAKALGVLAIAGAAWLAARAVRGLVRLALRRSDLDPMLKNVIVSAAGLAVYFAGAVAAAAVLGMSLWQLFVTFGGMPLLAGWILRGPLGNVMGGLAILGDEERPFDIGSLIQVGDNEELRGVVEGVTLTHTRLRNGTKVLIVPNSKFLDAGIGYPKE